MDEKMKAALEKECRELGLTVSESFFAKTFVIWALDYLREQQEPAVWIGTKLVPHEERVFKTSRSLAEKLGYSHDLREYYAYPVPSALSPVDEELRRDAEQTAAEKREGS